jgi:hypothetical protein
LEFNKARKKGGRYKVHRGLEAGEREKNKIK